MTNLWSPGFTRFYNILHSKNKTIEQCAVYGFLFSQKLSTAAVCSSFPAVFKMLHYLCDICLRDLWHFSALESKISHLAWPGSWPKGQIDTNETLSWTQLNQCGQVEVNSWRRLAALRQNANGPFCTLQGFSESLWGFAESRPPYPWWFLDPRLGVDELDYRLNHHKVHFSRWINHYCQHKISGWTLDFFFTTWTEFSKVWKDVRLQMFWWTGKCVSPWRNFRNGPWSRVGGGWECVSQWGRRAGRCLQLLADSLVNLKATYKFTSFHRVIRNKNH